MSRQPKAWLSMRQAADLIGWKDAPGARRLRDRLMAVQRGRDGHTGCIALLKAGGLKNGRRYVTTRTLLHRACPELFATAEHLPPAIQEALAEVREHVTELRFRSQALAGQLRASNKRIAELEARLAAAAE